MRLSYCSRLKNLIGQAYEFLNTFALYRKFYIGLNYNYKTWECYKCTIVQYRIFPITVIPMLYFHFVRGLSEFLRL